MKRIVLTIAVLGMGLLPILCALPAHAQATRTWISGVGDDANPCSRTAPCKTFAGAISKTAVAGEIDCLDPGGFGAITITKSITLLCEGMSNGGILVSGTNAINVAAGLGDNVVLRGLDINGIGGSGIAGINITSAGNVVIENSLIYGFQNQGINVQPGTQSVRVLISNTTITNNATGVAGKGGVVVLDHVRVNNNTNYGVAAVAGNVIMGNSTITNNATGLGALGGNLYSTGNNLVCCSTTTNGATPTPIPLE